MLRLRHQQQHRVRHLGRTQPEPKTTTKTKEIQMSDNESIFYSAWISDLQRDLDALREDKRELLRKVAQLEQLVAEYGQKINNLIQQRGDE
jgi:uncharacterized protein YlxW (UPF0749 family)